MLYCIAYCMSWLFADAFSLSVDNSKSVIYFSGNEEEKPPEIQTMHKRQANWFTKFNIQQALLGIIFECDFSVVCHLTLLPVSQLKSFEMLSSIVIKKEPWIYSTWSVLYSGYVPLTHSLCVCVCLRFGISHFQNADRISNLILRFVAFGTLKRCTAWCYGFNVLTNEISISFLFFSHSLSLAFKFGLVAISYHTKTIHFNRSIWQIDKYCLYWHRSYAHFDTAFFFSFEFLFQHIENENHFECGVRKSTIDEIRLMWRKSENRKKNKHSN